MLLNAKEIKNKRKSISNIRQITKAMEVVSATKMRKSQAIALTTRPYAKEALEILKTVSQRTDPSFSYLLEQRTEEKKAVLLITTDKGLCAGLNANIFRKTEELLLRYSNSQIDPVRNFAADAQKINGGLNKNQNGVSNGVDFVTIGKKGSEWCERKRLNVIKSFFSFGDYVDFEQTSPVSEFIIEIFQEKKYDAVWAVYTNFLSALKQEATARQILPLKEEGLKEIIASIVPTYGRFAQNQKNDIMTAERFRWQFEYKFEPDIKTVLDDLLYNLVQVEIYYLILESNASEHSARRLAMKNASDNAGNIIKDLNLLYNKARQAAITQEISEIAAGSGEL